VNEAELVGGGQRAGGLRDDRQRPVGVEDALALDDGRERTARDQLHDEVGRSLFLAVVEDRSHAVVVQQGGVPGLGAEALEEAGIAGVLLLEDLDGDHAAEHQVLGLPHLAHAADSDPVGQLEPTAQGDSRCRPHLLNTASRIFFMFGLVSVWPVA